MQDRISRTSQNHTSEPQTNPFQPKPFDIDTPQKSKTPTSDIDLNAAPEQGQHYGHDLTNIPIFPPKNTEDIPENESYEQQIQRQIGLSSLKPLNVPTFQELQERPNGKQLNYQKDPVVIPHWAVNSSNPVSPVQAKLTIGQPGDKYEQEADQVASQVVQRINSPAVEQSNQGQSVQRQEVPQEEEEPVQAKLEMTSLQRQEVPQEEEEPIQAKLEMTSLQRQEVPQEEEEPVQAKLEMSSLQRQEVPQEEEEPVQAKSILQRREAVGGGEASIDLDTAINSKRGSGQSLDAGLQRSMGQAMGADFSGVKIHTDAQSDQLNQSIQARAFTTGQDVFFRQGAYQPGSRDGQELIAHELTHVVQQNGGVVQRKLETNQLDGQPSLQKSSTSTLIQLVAEQNYTPASEEFDHTPGEEEAAEIGQEALQAVGYKKIIETALEVGFLRTVDGDESTNVQTKLQANEGLIFRQVQAAATAGQVFTRYAVAAGITSQLDSPAPGPADVVAIGILIVGLAAAGYVLMSSKGTPGNNKAQNKQFADAVREIERRIGRKLSQDEIRRLHDAISGQDFGYHDIVEEGVGMFGR